MRSLVLPSLLPLSLLLSASQASPACFEVEYHGLEYTSSSDQTVFSYSLTSSSDSGCKQALSFSILGDCPLAECPEASSSPSSSSHEGWSWSLPQALGTNQSYQVYVPGNINSVITGQWAIKTSDAILLGLTCVPDCAGTPPTQAPTDAPTQEPTLPNVGEPCELVMPSSLSLNYTGASSVSVSLASQPDGEVTVELASDCAFLDGCSLTFDPTNWSEPQSFGVTNDPSNPARLCSITLTANGTNSCEGAINITKAEAPKTESVCYGDPYVFTFDAVRYRLTQTTVGEDYYYLLRQPNSELIIQTDVQPCAIGECNNGAAIRYRGAFFQLLMDRNGTLTSSDNGNLEAEGVMTSTPSADSFMLDINSQAAIRLTAEFIASMNIYSLRVSIRLGASYMSNVAGLVGNFNGNRNDELLLPDGTQAADLAAFEVAWRVSAGENLFEDATATIGTLFGAQPYTAQTFPFVCQASD